MTDEILDARPDAPGIVASVMRAIRVLLTAGFLAFGVWAAFPALSQLVPLAEPAATLAPGTATASPATVASVQAAVQQAQQVGRAVETSITLTNADLTRAAQPYFPQTYAGTTVSSPSVRIASGQVVLTASARTFLGTTQLVATAAPTASGGRVLVAVRSVTLGGVTLPENVRTQVTQQLQSAIDGVIGTKFQVTSLSTSEGVLTLKGTALP